MQDKIYVTGHKNPDTDTICASIAYADYLRQKGKNAVAVKAGEINPETKYVLKHFKAEVPETMTDAAGKRMVLLDHNEKIESPDNIERAEITEVIDHHKINFSCLGPIYFHTEPIGSTSSIIAKKFLNDKDVGLTKPIAGLLLSAILSDTVIFKSATSTSEDRKIARRLAETAGIKNIEEFGMQIKKAKASMKGLTAREAIFSDFKNFNLDGKKVGIGQIEIVDVQKVNRRKQEFIKELEKIAKDKNYDLVALAVTDIIRQGTELLFWEKENYIEKAFSKESKNNTIYLKEVMSRKKQIIPLLTKLFSKK